MNSSTKNEAGKPEQLNVAIATETILYTPFFLAYHGGDFEDTPFGSLTVNIIGPQDLRFKTDVNLKGDGFATFCLLFGLADAAVCDPSYLAYLKNGNLNFYDELGIFEQLLENSTKEYLKEKYPHVLQYNDGKLSLIPVNKEELDKILNILYNSKNVIGGMVSKVAFSAAVNKDYYDTLELSSYKNEKFAKREKNKIVHQKEIDGIKNQGVAFIKDNIRGNFICYGEPSTGNCIGQIHANIYEKIGTKIINEDFGKELTKLSFKKEGDKEKAYKDSAAITCDFVALDFLENEEKDVSKQVIQIQDLGQDNENYLFTGILGNCDYSNLNKLRAFLYGIDMNLYIIQNFLYERNTTGLTKYLKRKYNYNKQTQSSILKLLVAHPHIREEIQSLINDDTDRLDFTFDTVIEYFVKRLYRWRAYGGLYYSSTKPVTTDLKNMVDLRCCAGDNSMISDTEVEKNIHVDLLADWRKEEDRIIAMRERANDTIKSKKTQTIIFIFITLLKSPFRKLNKKIKEDIELTTWYLINKPTFIYWVGVSFIVFEIVTGLTHLFYIHYPKIDNCWINIPQFTVRGKKHNYCITWDLIRYGTFIYLSLIIVNVVFPAYSIFWMKRREKYIYRQ